jgi:hypothetical protein
MSTPTVTTRRFTKEFSTLRNQSVAVTDRGQLVGTWTPAPRKRKTVDFMARAKADTKGKLEFTGAELLRENKKR